MSTRPRLTLFCLAFALLAASPAGAEPPPKWDFEENVLPEPWVGAGKIEVARQALPAPGPAGGPAGAGLRLAAVANSGLVIPRVPQDFRPIEEVVFWAYRSPEEVKARPSAVLELRVSLRKEGGGFWRKIELAHTGWREVRVPLAWCRWTDGKPVPQWDVVESIGLRFRDPANLWIDELALVDRDPQRGAALTLSEVLPIAFPGAAEGAVRTSQSERWAIATDMPELDLAKLDGHFERIEKLVAGELPLAERPLCPLVFIVHRQAEDYRQFPPRAGARLNSLLAAPRSGGFTFMNISCSSWDERYGTLRNVYSHEFVHGLLTTRAGLHNRGEWLQEGYASWVQLRLHPQADLPKIVAAGLADPQAHLPLAQLASGQPIPTNRYWQAATLVECLAKNDPYAAKFPNLVTAIRQSGTTDLGPHLKPILDTDWPSLEAAWRKHCRERYPAK